MAWGAYLQPGLSEEIDGLGARLSVEIGCPVHYPAYGKNLFECKCGVVFPLYLVRAENWEMIKRKHQEEKVLVR